MNKDRLVNNILKLILLIILFLALFKPNILSIKGLTIILILYAISIKLLLKRRKTLLIHNKQIMFLMMFFAFIYLSLFYLSGFYFGFYEASIKFGFKSLFNTILPLVLLIFITEYIRYVLLSQKSRTSFVIVTFAMVVLDVILYSSVYDIKELDDFLIIVGFIIFASFSNNLLFNFISIRYGYKSNFIYKVLTSIYMYIIPIVPNVYVLFRTVFRMIYPYIIYLVLDYGYSKRDKKNEYLNRKSRFLSVTIMLIISIFITMLVSCKFTYGILVVGSGSMTGTINKGDAIVFKKYNQEKLHENEIIIFNRDKRQIVHRIIDVKKINNGYMYFTKGDANYNIDKDYVVNNDVVGVVKFKIPYIGNPTIWIKDLFSKGV